jgi:uncharacterized membrane protein
MTILVEVAYAMTNEISVAVNFIAIVSEETDNGPKPSDFP